MDNFKQFLHEFYISFRDNNLQYLKQNIKKYSIFIYKRVSIPDGKDEFVNNIIKNIIVPDTNMVQQMIFNEISNFKDEKLLEKLFCFIQRNYYSFKDKNLEESLKKRPSVCFNIFSGFILRAFEIADSQLVKIILTDENFEIVFKELKNILNSDCFEYEELIGLYGVTGEKEFTYKNFSVKKATKELADKFCYFYNDNQGLFDELLEGQFYLEVKRKALKSDFQGELINVRNDINKIVKLIKLCGNGNIERGKSIRVSDDWSIIRSNKIEYSLRSNPYVRRKNQFPFIISDLVIKSIIENYDYICGINSEIVNDNSILTSIKRLFNSKRELSINDKFVELSLALEYSIKTDRVGISKALREKSAVLYNYDDLTDYENTKKIIKKFYEIRGDIIHGKKEIEYNDDNIKLIKEAENIIRNNLLLLIKLNKKYSMDEIDNTIKELFSDAPKTPLRNNLVV